MTARRAPEWLTRWEYAHRGLHRPGVPENSLAAAEGAIARGMGIECDIQISADGVPLVFHDWELSRLTEAEGMVASRTADELETLPLLGTDERLPRLATFLECVSGDVPLLIEVKSLPGLDVERVCRMIRVLLVGYSGDVAVMSFDPRVPNWFKDSAPEITRGLVGTDSFENGFEGVWRRPEALSAAQPDFLAIDVRDLTRPEASAWRKGGRPLLTWTVRSPDTRTRGLAHADNLIAEGEGLA